MQEQTKFIELKKVFKTLHGPKGCLWDKRQTHKTLIPYLKEEVGEFIREVKDDNCHYMKEELGDILLQVMFHAQIASKPTRIGLTNPSKEGPKDDRFDIEDVIEVLIKKLKRRHPHVFGNTKVKSTREIIANWNKIKIKEKRRKKKHA